MINAKVFFKSQKIPPSSNLLFIAFKISVVSLSINQFISLSKKSIYKAIATWIWK